MASQLFHDLYERAYRLDCALIHKLNDFADPNGFFYPFATTELVPLAEAALAGWADFKASLHQVALRHGMYRHKFKERCPHCGQADCPGAVPIIELKFSSPQAMQDFLLGKDPESGK